MKMFNKKQYEFSLDLENRAIFNRLELFAQGIFNYLNGKINTINKFARLSIDYNIYQNKEGNFINGSKRFPNLVILYLNAILYNNKPNINYIGFYEMQILYTLTHELSHCDQIVDSEYYNQDPIYYSKIESENDYNTINFLLSHKDEMIQIFGDCIYRAFLFFDLIKDRNMYTKDFIKYNRHDLFTMYTETLNKSIGEYISFSVSDLLYEVPNIRMIINDNIYVIQYNFYLNENIQELLNLLYPIFLVSVEYNVVYNLDVQTKNYDKDEKWTTIYIRYRIESIDPITLMNKGEKG